MARPRVTDEMKGEIAAMFEAEIPIPGIAEEMQLSDVWVKTLLREMGYVLNTKIGRPSIVDTLDGVTLQAIADDYVAGKMFNHEIALKYGITINELFTIRQKLDLPKKRAGTDESRQARRDRLDLAVEMYNNPGIQLWKIKLETGVGGADILWEIHKRGLPTRRSKEYRAAHPEYYGVRDAYAGEVE